MRCFINLSNKNLQLVVAVLCSLVLLTPPECFAADGAMIVVTANPGKIMDGTKVLAEVPMGTRLWYFTLSQDKNWVELKVPNREERGWMLRSSIDTIKRTDLQEAELKQADIHYDNFQKHVKEQKLADALVSLEKCYRIEQAIFGPDHPNVASTLNNMGIVAGDRGDYQTAQKYLDEALAIKLKMLGNGHIETARTIHNLGNLAYTKGDYPAARKYYDDALSIKRKVLGNQHIDVAGTLNNLGNLAIDQGDYPAARKYYDDALAIKRKILGNQHIETAGTLYNLGELARKQGDYPAARKYYDDALTIQRQVQGNQNLAIADTINGLGLLAYAQMDYPAARKYYDDALTIYRKILGNQHTNTARTLHNMGALARDQADYQVAKKYYDEALAIRRKVLGDLHISTAGTLQNLGVLAIDQADYPAAKKYYDEALAIYRKVLGDQHTSTAQMLNNLGVLAYAQEDYSTARKYYDENRRVISAYVQRTLPGLSEEEQIQFLDNTYLNAWKRYLSFGWNQRNETESAEIATSWLINGKAVAQESLAGRALLTRDTDNPKLAPLVRELTAIRKQLAAMALSTPKPSEAVARQTQLAHLNSEEQRLARMLVQTTGEASSISGWVELDALSQNIAADAVYVDLVRMGIYDFKKNVISAPHYLAWIMQSNRDIHILDLGEAELIEAALERARASLANASDPQGMLRLEGEAAAAKKLDSDLQAVADLVLKPLLPQLKEKQQLILSPDGALWLLPWAALPVTENKCLLEQCSIRYVTSGRDLVKNSGTSKLGLNAPAIVVNPNYDLTGTAAKATIRAILPQMKFDENETRTVTSQSSLPRVSALPFTSLEGAAAKSSFEQLSKNAPIFYEQEQALEAVVKKLQRPKHLLLSTHGFFLSDQQAKESNDKQLLANNNTHSWPALTTDGKPVENPLLRCGLLLAGCNSPRMPGIDDGILTGLEIVGMDLRGTELVVLSACETGIGKVRNGEGVAGLRQAFQLAGAQSVVSTLWQVPDRDSALIMQDFFTNLAAGQSKADALRNAQLKRIAARKDKFGAAHPFFWAAWTLTGE
jgi:CHAT domain-containing protein/Tfp pilus assembly protein PilF